MITATGPLPPTLQLLTSQEADAARHLFLVKFGAVSSYYSPCNKPNKWYGHQNCGVKGHREMKTEYGKLFLRQRDNIVAEGEVWACRVSWVPPKEPSPPDNSLAKPGYWRVAEKAHQGKEC